mmetsp:Transcript_11103/g.33272  ORF Transcript_11103/g.33272 Transcript_11103/m.33272 type:complete len:354 (-) Transcript_11103:305-1366(-)
MMERGSTTSAATGQSDKDGCVLSNVPEKKTGGWRDGRMCLTGAAAFVVARRVAPATALHDAVRACVRVPALGPSILGSAVCEATSHRVERRKKNGHGGIERQSKHERTGTVAYSCLESEVGSPGRRHEQAPQYRLRTPSSVIRLRVQFGEFRDEGDVTEQTPRHRRRTSADPSNNRRAHSCALVEKRPNVDAKRLIERSAVPALLSSQHVVQVAMSNPGKCEAAVERRSSRAKPPRREPPKTAPRRRSASAARPKTKNGRAPTERRRRDVSTRAAENSATNSASATATRSSSRQQTSSQRGLARVDGDAHGVARSRRRVVNSTRPPKDWPLRPGKSSSSATDLTSLPPDAAGG